MVARKWKIVLGLSVAVLGLAAFSPPEAEAGRYGGRSVGFHYSSFRGGYGPVYHRGASFHSSRFYGGGFGYRAIRAPRYYCPPPRPIYYVPAPVYRPYCGW